MMCALQNRLSVLELLAYVNLPLELFLSLVLMDRLRGEIESIDALKANV